MKETNFYDALVVAIPAILSILSPIIMTIINKISTNQNKKAINESKDAIHKNTLIVNDNKDAIDKNIIAINDNKDAIHKIGKEMNGNLLELIKSKEQIAYSKGANSTNINDTSYELSKIWIYLKDRALAECIVKGFINSFNDDELIISEEVKKTYKNLIPELKSWYQENKNLNDLELFKECEYKFGQRIVEQVCKFHQISNGSCIQIAVMLAKEE